MNWTVGTGRRVITPPWGVELAGWGYYLNRTWERIHDELAATAVVIGDENGGAVAIVAADLMYNDAEFTRMIRERVAARTTLQPEAICVNCSHSHNSPTAVLFRGGGERDPEYVRFAAAQAATAAIVAWRSRQPARLRVGAGRLEGMTFNRTREHGPVDTRVGVLRADALDGRPIAVIINFHAHPAVFTELDPRAVSRDCPGEVVDLIEAALPGATAIYLQGACGDVEFRRDLRSPDSYQEPARALAGTALQALSRARPIETAGVAAFCDRVSLPTRRWRREEVMRHYEEGRYRLESGDTTGWLEGIASVMVGQPKRLPLRYGGSVERAVAAISRFAVEWAEQVLPQLDTAPETLEAEVQALRIGDVHIAANASEFFTAFALDLRSRWPGEDLFVLGYSNGAIGYLPDAHDIERGTYAALQSPKALGQFPYTPGAGPAMVEGLLAALQQTTGDRGK